MKSLSLRSLGLAVLCLLWIEAGLCAEEPAVNFILDTEHAEHKTLSSVVSFDGYLQRGSQSFISVNDAANFELQIQPPQQGYYRVYAWWPLARISEDESLARYRIRSDGTVYSVSRAQHNLAGQWNRLTEIAAFSSDPVTIEIGTKDGKKFLVDAFRLEFIGDTLPSIEIDSQILPVATVGEAFTYPLKSIGCDSGCNWSAVQVLPRGLSLDPVTGVISGTPREAGTFDFEILVISESGEVVSSTLTIDIVLPASGQVQHDNLSTKAAPAQSKSINLQSKSISNLMLESTTLLDEVSSMPEGSWLKVNQNLFSDVWSPAELRPLNLSSNPAPEKIIVAWSSFAWDWRNGVLFLYGGGHANYSGNDVYLWKTSTRSWERGSLPSEIVQDDLGNWRAIDGVNSAPSSAHTYDNNVYLPMARRFMTYGGAAYNNGGAYKMQIDSSTDRETGPYIYNPALAHPDSVGGSTGSHVQRVAPHPEVVGGHMWENRDIYGNVSASSPLPVRFVNGTTAVSVEDGHDVVFVSAVSGGTASQLYKHTIIDINDPSADKWEKVGRYWNAFGDQGAGAFSAQHNVFVRTAGTRLVFWDLNHAGPNNDNQLFEPADSSGQFVPNRDFGLDFHSMLGRFYLWEGGGKVWVLTPPDTMSVDGWSISLDSNGGSVTPTDNSGTGILGKWKYAADLNAFVGLQDSQAGNIWLYKPVGWTPPGPQNQPPGVAITTPENGSSYLEGENISITASASDTDGGIASVEFFANGLEIGLDFTAPYSVVWNNVAAGMHSLTAVARDNQAAETTSAAITIDVLSDNILPTATLTNPADGAQYIEGSMVQLEADAADADGSVTRVEFYSGATLLATDFTAPYSYSWSSPAVGIHSVTSRAVDNDGASVTSNAISIEILSNNVAPEVFLTGPLNGEAFTAGDTVLLSAIATDSDGSVERVEFYWQDNLLGAVFTPPYEYSWSNVPVGMHMLSARAVDNDDAVTASTAVTIEVTGVTGVSSVTLQDGLSGYSGTRDVYLSGWHKTSNFGTSTQLRDQSGRYVSLLEFAIFQSEGGPVPDGAIIDSAVLEIYKYTSYDHSYQAHRLLTGWEENGATWNESQPGVMWSQVSASGAGQDYLAASDGNGDVGWSPGWLGIDVTAGVQAMSLGAMNHGWRITAISGNSNPKRFYSREATADQVLRPKLTIHYSFGGNTLPTTTLTNPADGAQYIEGSMVQLEADAADADGSVTRVEFYSGATLLATDFTAPYSYSWSSPAVGIHNVTSRAVDNDGASVTSNAISIEILSNNVAPEMLLTGPLNGEVFTAGDTVLLSAIATDSDGSVERVEFYWQDNLLGAVFTPPYEYSWSNVPVGMHMLSARAVDNDDAVTASTAVTIEVTGVTGVSSVTLQDGLSGYSGTRDVYLSDWHKTSNFGTSTQLRDQSGRYVSLLEFAIFQSEGGPVPDGAIIDSAVLEIYKYTSYDHSYQAHRLLTGWEENGATWNESQPGVMWSQVSASGAGQDYLAASDGSGDVGWSPGWLGIDVTAGVQAMSLGAMNHGWRITAISGNSNPKRFYSREATADQVLRPKLIISFH